MESVVVKLMLKLGLRGSTGGRLEQAIAKPLPRLARQASSLGRGNTPVAK